MPKATKVMKVKAWPFGRAATPYFPDDFEIKKYDILQWTDMRANHNKYYGLELHVGSEGGKTYHRIFTHYGRTDDLEADPSSGRKECRFYPSLSTAQTAYQSIFDEKTGSKGYRKVELSSANMGSSKLKSMAAASLASLAIDAAAQSSGARPDAGPSKLEPKLRVLVEYLYAEATAQLTSSISARITARGIETPLGVLRMPQVLRGEAVLDQLIGLHTDGTLDRPTAERLSGDFYTLIPHKLGRTKAAMVASIIDTTEKFEEKKELLQLMKDMLALNSDGALNASRADEKYDALRNTISVVDPSSSAYAKVERLVLDTQVKFSGISITGIYSLGRAVEERRFSHHLSNKPLLFHGSRVSNWVGILSRGILMPRKVVSLGGKRTDYGLLGAGIYFGSDSTTSAQYCTAGTHGKRFMLVCRVALGSVYETRSICSSMEEAPEGYQSVRGVSSRHGMESDFDDDEYVVYQPEQQKQAFLVEFTLDKEPPKKNYGMVAPSAASSTSVPAHHTTTPSHMVTTTASTTAFPSPSTSSIGGASKRPFEIPATSPFAIPSGGGGGDAATSPFAISSGGGDAATTSLFAIPSGGDASTTSPFAISSGGLSFASSATSDVHPITSSPAPAGVMGPSPMYTRYNELLTEQQKTLKSKEDRLRELFSLHREHSDISDPYVSLLDAFQHPDRFIYASESDGESAQPKLLAQHRPDMSALDGSPSCVSQTQWISNWRHFTQGVFAGMDWSNVFVAGGSVLWTMEPTFQDKVAEDSSFPRGSDVDLFLYGLTPSQANLKLRRIFSTIQRNTGGKGDIIRTKHAITILGTYPHRHIQIILRLYKSPAEVLIGFDIDSCCVGYDGSKVWVLPRALRAINSRYNLLDLSRRSLTYESRLRKYSKRGFCVAVPGLELDRVDPFLHSKGLRQVKGLAKLLIMDRQETKSLLPRRKYTKKKVSVKPPKAPKEDEEKDYSEVAIPWGPLYASSASIVRVIAKKDKAAFFSRIRANKAVQSTTRISHIYVQGIDAVLNDTERMGPLKWLTENPGRQLLTGSFHPVDDEHYVDDAYGLASSSTTTSAPSSSSSGAHPIAPHSSSSSSSGPLGMRSGDEPLRVPISPLTAPVASTSVRVAPPASPLSVAAFGGPLPLQKSPQRPWPPSTPSPPGPTRVDAPRRVERTAAAAIPLTGLESKLRQVFREPVAPRSPSAKLLLLISVLSRAGKIDAGERSGLKDLVILQDTGLYAALEVFEVEQDWDELCDTFKRLLKVRPGAW